MESLLQDIRFAARLLRRNLGFTAAVVFTLALGISGNTAIFGVVNNIFFRPLPFKDADRLVRLRDYTTAPDGQRDLFNISDQHFLEIANNSRVFDGVAALNGDDFTLTGDDVPQRLSGVNVSPGWLETLGVQPILGRGFTADEERSGRDSGVALIGYGMWQRRFGGTDRALGQKLALDDRSYTIVGVLPGGFNFPYNAELWMPATINPNRDASSAVFARLKPNVSVAQAQSEMQNVADRIKELYPETMAAYGIDVMSARASLIQGEERMAVTLLAVVGFLLLLACINVANLVLARSVSRNREMAIRAALGASRWRQIRQVFTESLLLGLLGCAGGLLLTLLLSDYLAVLVPTNLTRQLNLSTVTVDWRVLSFALFLSLLTGIVCGLAPAAKVSQVNLRTFLQDGGRGTTGGRTRRLLNTFVISQIALALILLSGAGLMLQNFQRLQHRGLGFDKDHLLTMAISLPPNRYTDGASRLSTVKQITQAVSSIPGVSATGVTTVNPLYGWQSSTPIILEGGATMQPDSSPSVNHRLVTPDLFATLGVPLLKGRWLTEHDDATSPPVVVVSNKMAQRFWPNKDPIGKRVRVNRPDRPWLTIVGVVGDVKDAGELSETWYLPYYQQAATGPARDLHLMVRSADNTDALTHEAQQAIARVDQNLAAYNVNWMDRIYDDTLAQDRIGTVTVTVLAAFGLILATLGIYGVLSYVVGQRINEIGIRMALGAQPADVLRLLIRQGIVLAFVGVLFGVAMAVVINRVFASVLTEVTTASPIIYAGVSGLLLLIALAACYIPARRATRIDPLIALRHE